MRISRFAIVFLSINSTSFSLTPYPATLYPFKTNCTDSALSDCLIAARTGFVRLARRSVSLKGRSHSFLFLDSLENFNGTLSFRDTGRLI